MPDYLLLEHKKAETYSLAVRYLQLLHLLVELLEGRFPIQEVSLNLSLQYNQTRIVILLIIVYGHTKLGYFDEYGK